MADVNQKDTIELLAQAKKFCSGIGAYIESLGLSKRKVVAFKNDVQVLAHLVEDNNAFTQDFISYNFICVRGGLTALIAECTLSPGYTHEIGDKLGIQFPLNNTAGLKTEFKVKWSNPITDVRDLIGTKLVSK